MAMTMRGDQIELLHHTDAGRHEHQRKMRKQAFARRGLDAAVA